MDPQGLAKVYQQQVAPGWEDRFVPFLMENFPGQLPAKCTLLELNCTTGQLTKEVADRLPQDGRLVCLDDNRDLLEIARSRLGSYDRQRIFFKKEPPGKLNFADHTFDGVLAAGLHPDYDLATIIGEASRLLKKDGFLLLGLPVQGSFQELFDIFREVLEKEDLNQPQAELDAWCQRFPDRPSLGRLLGGVGLAEVKTKTREESIRFPSGLDLLASPLVRQLCLEGCLRLIQDRGWREGVLAGMALSLDTYFPEGIELTLILGRLEGTKP